MSLNDEKGRKNEGSKIRNQPIRSKKNESLGRVSSSFALARRLTVLAVAFPNTQQALERNKPLSLSLCLS